MSPTGMQASAPSGHPSGLPDPGVFGQEMLTAMAKMMATAMTTGAFNAANIHQHHQQQQQTGAHMQNVTPRPPRVSNPGHAMGGGNRMSSFDSHSQHTFRLTHSSSSMPTQHQNSSSGSGYRYPTVAMTNPYRSPPHDPYNNMYQ